MVELGAQVAVVRTYFGLLADVVRAPHRPFKLESARHLMMSMLYGYLHGRSAISVSVGVIASRLNFPSQSVFGKYFKRVTGLSPKEYRESLRENLP